MINELSRQFMRNYFKSAHGSKCTLGWPWRGDEHGGPIMVGYPKLWYAMKGLVDKDFVQFRTLHQFAYIFSDIGVSNTEGWKIEDHIVGVAPVVDIDSPNITGSNKRLDCLLENDAIEKFEKVRVILKDKLKDWGAWDGVRSLFSGNGIYYIMEDQYGSNDELDEFLVGFIEMCKDVNWKSGMELIDINNSYPWNNFYKAPFTLHWRYNRLSIPLDKNKVIKRDYLKDNCGLDCDVYQVMEDCKW